MAIRAVVIKMTHWYCRRSSTHGT